MYRDKRPARHRKSFIIAILTIFIALAVGEALASNYPLEIIQPRAGLDTRNRFYKAYPGIEYNVRVAVIGGAYPFTYSLVSSPPGMTINSNTGTITWPSPSVGGPYTVTARVVDQEATSTTVTWTVTATTSGFLFVDAVNGSRSARYGGTGTGTIDNPFKQIDDWYCTGSDVCQQIGPNNNKTSSTYTGQFIYYRTGTYNVFRSESVRLAMINNAKPLVWLAYPGESPVLDMSAAHMNFYANSNSIALDGLEIKDVDSGGNYLGVVIAAAANNVTIRRNNFHTLPSSPGSNNQSLFFIGADDKGRHWAITENVFSDVGRGYGILGYVADRVLIEDNIFHNITSDLDNAGYPLGMKESCTMWFVRHNTFYNNPHYNIYALFSNTRGPSGNIDISYNVVRSTPGYALNINPAGYTGGAVHAYRNTLVGSVAFSSASSATGPYDAAHNIVVNSSGSPEHIDCTSCTASYMTRTDNLSGTPTNNIVNSSGNLTSAYMQYFGLRGYQTNQTINNDNIPPASPMNLRVQ